jgi:hypothetical protein
MYESRQPPEDLYGLYLEFQQSCSRISLGFRFTAGTSAIGLAVLIAAAVFGRSQNWNLGFLVALGLASQALAIVVGILIRRSLLRFEPRRASDAAWRLCELQQKENGVTNLAGYDLKLTIATRFSKAENQLRQTRFLQHVAAVVLTWCLCILVAFQFLNPEIEIKRNLLDGQTSDAQADESYLLSAWNTKLAVLFSVHQMDNSLVEDAVVVGGTYYGFWFTWDTLHLKNRVTVIDEPGLLHSPQSSEEGRVAQRAGPLFAQISNHIRDADRCSEITVAMKAGLDSANQLELSVGMPGFGLKSTTPSGSQFIEEAKGTFRFHTGSRSDDCVIQGRDSQELSSAAEAALANLIRFFEDNNVTNPATGVISPDQIQEFASDVSEIIRKIDSEQATLERKLKEITRGIQARIGGRTPAGMDLGNVLLSVASLALGLTGGIDVSPSLIIELGFGKQDLDEDIPLSPPNQGRDPNQRSSSEEHDDPSRDEEIGGSEKGNDDSTPRPGEANDDEASGPTQEPGEEPDADESEQGREEVGRESGGNYEEPNEHPESSKDADSNQDTQSTD